MWETSSMGISTLSNPQRLKVSNRRGAWRVVKGYAKRKVLIPNFIACGHCSGVGEKSHNVWRGDSSCKQIWATAELPHFPSRWRGVIFWRNVIADLRWEEIRTRYVKEFAKSFSAQKLFHQPPRFFAAHSRGGSRAGHAGPCACFGPRPRRRD